MKTWLSEEARDYVLKQYPWLTKNDVYAIVNQSTIKVEEEMNEFADEKGVNISAHPAIMINSRVFKMYISTELADEYNIDTCIDLIVDKNGICYYQQEEESQ